MPSVCVQEQKWAERRQTKAGSLFQLGPKKSHPFHTILAQRPILYSGKSTLLSLFFLLSKWKQEGRVYFQAIAYRARTEKFVLAAGPARVEKICHQFFFLQPWSFPNLFLADYQIKNVIFVDLVFLYCLIGGKFEVGVVNDNKKKQWIVLKDLMSLLVTPWENKFMFLQSSLKHLQSFWGIHEIFYSLLCWFLFYIIVKPKKTVFLLLDLSDTWLKLQHICLLFSCSHASQIYL